MPGTVTIRRTQLAAQFDVAETATLHELVPLVYEREMREGLPAHVRAASAVRRFANHLVIVQDDVDALAVREASGTVRPVLLPLRLASRVFDDAHGNKRDKLDLEACVALADGRLVAFGSGSSPKRERLVVWSPGAAPVIVDAATLYAEVREAVTRNELRLNVEGVAACGPRLLLFHRGNDAPRDARMPTNAIVELDLAQFGRWLGGAAPVPRVVSVASVELGAVGDVAFGFTDAVALDAERVIVLACAEDSESALADGAVLGARVGLLDEHGVRMVDVCEAGGGRTRLKLEGIERRPDTEFEFDVVVDVDRPAVPAQLGRLVWKWR